MVHIKKSEDNLWELVVSSTMWILGMELKRPDLAASTLPQGAMSLESNQWLVTYVLLVSFCFTELYTLYKSVCLYSSLPSSA